MGGSPVCATLIYSQQNTNQTQGGSVGRNGEATREPMIGRLVGTIVSEEATGALMLDVLGVGYELVCPVGTGAKAGTVSPELHLRANQESNPGDDNKIVVYVHTNLRQDALELYGFCELIEREAFRMLVTVPNVGPRLAIAVLNVLPAAQLAEVIEAEDKVRLVKVPGVGKKTAERLVLELRGKLTLNQSSEGKAVAQPRSSQTSSKQRLITALTGLGYRNNEAEKAAKALLVDDCAEIQLSSLLRKALDYLAP